MPDNPTRPIVGNSIYYHDLRGQLRSHLITKVGTKYFYVTKAEPREVHVPNGYSRWSLSTLRPVGSCWSVSGYLSLQDLEDSVQAAEVRSALQCLFAAYNSRALTLEQLRRIKVITDEGT